LGASPANRGLKPVKSSKASSSGFYDLIGNAAEWCQDVDVANPQGRPAFGGSWMTDSLEALKAASHRTEPIAERFPDVGFRVVLEFATEPGDKP
jgi:formylglycine-generating enzyme required for sulfatase activity